MCEFVVKQLGDIVSIYGYTTKNQIIRLFHGVTNPRTGISPVIFRWVFSEYLAFSSRMT